jgi:cytochrome c oxidase assembly protein subunit 15
MTDALAAGRHDRPVRIWLYLVAAMIFGMVMLGGATRLTESGLSIVEWRPVTGALPPLSEGDWQAEFDKYKTTPQFKNINKDMTLDAFRTIYWWEWAHRNLGRLIGFVFFLPFIYFLARGWIAARMRGPLAVIFALGALQGGVGWWMVKSGLADRVSVSQYWLAFHMTLASVIYTAVLWAGQRLRPQAAVAVPTRLRRTAILLVPLVLLQIYLGALVAGLNAGLVYNTWPLIDGTFVPRAEHLFFISPAWRNFFENDLTVQFVHRMVAYTLWIVAVLHALDAVRSLRDRAAASGALSLAIVVTLQAMLGIATLLHQAPLPMALAHQAMAIIVLTFAVLNAARLTAKAVGERRDAAASPPTLSPASAKGRS